MKFDKNNPLFGSALVKAAQQEAAKTGKKAEDIAKEYIKQRALELGTSEKEYAQKAFERDRTTSGDVLSGYNKLWVKVVDGTEHDTLTMPNRNKFIPGL